MSKLIPQLFNNPILYDIEEYTKKAIDSLTEKEKKAIRIYSSQEYKYINGMLREGKLPTEFYHLIDSGLKKLSYDKRLTVYRKLFIKDLWIDKESLKKFTKLLDKGFILDKAYQSTSLNPISFRSYNNVLIEIDVKNPKKGAYISPICILKEEEEFLLHRDTRIDIEDYSIDDDWGLIKVKGSVR